MTRNDEPDYKRIFAAVFLAAIFWTGWQAFVEWPRRQALQHYQTEQKTKTAEAQAKAAKEMAKTSDTEENPALTRAQRLIATPRVGIRSDKLHGSISLKGARFDDVTLAEYRETLDPASPEVKLFSPNGDEKAYFAQIGWIAADGTRVPDAKSLWQADKNTLSPGETVTLRWDNGAGVAFLLNVSLDRDYMFSIEQRVENHSGHAVEVMPYAYINRVYVEPGTHIGLWHEGPMGALGEKLEEVKYSSLRDEGNKEYDTTTSWLGITDKYWMSALIPVTGQYKTTFSHYSKDGFERYQVDYLGAGQKVENNSSNESRLRLFAGAKVVSIIDRYAAGDATENQPPIPLFDRAIDFGMLYFLAKPMFLVLNFFFQFAGNFGVAILLLTVVVRGVLFPLASKSFKASAQMRRLQPEMVKIREKYFDDQITMNKEMLALYKREKVNPASGCLPVLLQMPVFFALYRLLSVTIEMRHAPFFGWLKDMSEPDPSNLFTAFGLVPWDAPGWLHLGLLPMLYTITMIIQMKQQPKPADPVQAQMMSWMPYIFLFIFAKMPAGLVLYWTWSNMLSILQQQFITRYHGALPPKAKAAA